MNMEQYENRFGFYREKTTEELEKIIMDLEDELEYDKNLFEDKNTSSEQKTDAGNDIKQTNDELFYLNILMEERKNGRAR